MPEERSLSLDELAATLKTGVTTLNVWRKRYGAWLPDPVDREGRRFPERILDLFRMILRCTQVGMDSREIERVLDAREGSPRPVSDHGTASSQAIIDAFKETVAGLTVQQQRIADAQERRASAEERKAFAMESQAEAELIKANALKDMVRLLQDMPERDPVAALMDKVRSMPAPAPMELEDFTADHGYAPEQLEDLPEISELSDFDALPAEEPLSDALAGAFEPASAAAVLEPEAPPPMDVDDLSVLIDDDLEQPTGSAADVDDLAQLLEPGDVPDRSDIDDLSRLLDDEQPVESLRAAGETAPEGTVDDLSLLLEADDQPRTEEPPARRSSPVDENYKSAILKRIIRMKQTEHLTVEDVTRRFNDEGVKTLSGKGVWDTKTIQGIYRYIDSVQGG
ncbi:hypothetical protein JCM14469_29080 [Desulfatiferula olefinivorans]